MLARLLPIFVAFALFTVSARAAEQKSGTYQLAYRAPGVAGGDYFTKSSLLMTLEGNVLGGDGHKFQQVEAGSHLYRVVGQPMISEWSYLYILENDSFLHRTVTNHDVTYYVAKLPNDDPAEKQAVWNAMKAAEKEAAKEIDADFERYRRQVADAYVAGFRSQPKIGGLEETIRNGLRGSPNKIIKVGFMDRDYEIVRNWRGEVMRKNAAALLFLKMPDGRCAVEWGHYGYESVGGGRLARGLSVQTTREAGSPMYFKIGSKENGQIELVAGSPATVDCTAVK